MEVKIHYTLPDGTEDYVCSAGTLKEIREHASEIKEAKEKHGATDFWSEQID